MRGVEGSVRAELGGRGGRGGPRAGGLGGWEGELGAPTGLEEDAGGNCGGYREVPGG